MFIATVVIAVILAGLLLLSGYGKLTRNEEQITTIKNVGFPERYIWLLAVCEIAGAVGIILGLFWWPIGIAAAIGVIAYFVLAVGSHLRKRHYAIQASSMLLVLGIAYLALPVLSGQTH